LTRQDARSLLPAPGVAQSWDISPDGLTYTFHLRSDAVWSDGKQLGPEDFVYSWRRMLDPALGAEYAYILYPVKGARAFNTFASLADSIDQTIVPELSKAWTDAAEGGLARQAWSEFASRLNLKEVLQYSRDPAIRELLAEPAGSPTPIQRERLRRFLTALPAEATRLRAELRDVSARFGSSLGVYASDARTLVVELEAPTPYFLDLTSFYSALPVPRHVLEKWGDAWFLPETIVSNGPFELESWRVNDRVRLRKSQRYWGRAEVHADSIEILPT
jgi:oligopeptide transport system substrate-binding protein